MRESHNHHVLKPIKSLPGVDGTGVQIDNLVDVSQMNNQEVAMRVSTDVDSGEEFFTDLNGFQGPNSNRKMEISIDLSIEFTSELLCAVYLQY